MTPRILVTNHQDSVPIDLDRLNTLAAAAVLPALEEPARRGAPLASLEEIEVTIVSDETIARVHEQFMDIAGPTDVITFDHGEIIVSADTAIENAQRFDNTSDREVALYIIHGLLHLNGHEDGQEDARERMQKVQEKILKELWPENGKVDDSIA